MNSTQYIGTPWELFGVECGRGWSWIVVALMQTALNEGATITQVKEKFGGLRFYYYGGTDTLEKLVDYAEELASKTCECCGAPGKLRGKHWLQTLCDEHNDIVNGDEQ